MHLIGMTVALAILALSVVVALRIKRMWVRSSNKAFRFAPDDREDGPLVSVIIPARNEQDNIPAILETLLAQNYRPMEILVVDDASTDDTGKVARAFAERDGRVRVIDADALPPGWLGKNHACWQGARLARGEYLLFLDCDVRLENPGLVGGLVTHADANDTDLYSVIPRQHLRAFAERLFGPAVYAVMGLAFLPLDEANDPAEAKAAAVGQCMFFKRAAYERMGGHEALKSSIVEDVDFARLFKAAGMKTALHYGAGDITVRMYTSLSTMWEGWGKNLYYAAAGSFAKFLSIEFSFALAYLAPPLVLLWALWSLAAAATPYGIVCALAAAAVWGYGHYLRIVKYRAMCWSLRYEPAHEIAVVFALVLLVSSALKHARARGATWKGRSISHLTAEGQGGGNISPPAASKAPAESGDHDRKS
jgi:glycosyltransferase involved in cell wall biosynthesis